MDNDLKTFMEKTFPAGTRIRIDRAENEKMIGKEYLVGSVDSDGLHCTDENGNAEIIDPDLATFYKLDQPPVLAYGMNDEPAELTDVRQIAEFIVNNGPYCDISMYKKNTGDYVLNTMGIFIDRIADMDFRSELLTILVPLQQEYPFGMPKGQEESERKPLSDNNRPVFEYQGSEIYLELGEYASDTDVIALTMYTADDNEYFATLSVNLSEHIPLEPNQTFIDTNNLSDAEKFLSSIDGARPVMNNGNPVTGHSGYCEYPLYEFDNDLLCRLDPEGYERHFGNTQETEHNVRKQQDETEDMTMGMGGIS